MSLGPQHLPYPVEDIPLDPQASAILNEEEDEKGLGDVEDAEDGGAYVTLDNQTERDDNPGFFGNLAETLDSGALSRIALDLVDFIELDREARKPRDEQYAKALKRTGLDGEPTVGADFVGASKAVHPMIVEACIDFGARAITELFPLGGTDSGPVKSQIVGKATKDKVAKAERKAAYMNHQLTQQMPGFRDSLEQALVQTGFAGGQYLKLRWNRGRRRPEEVFVPADEVYLPYNATSFAGAERKTHAQTLTGLEYRRRVRAGEYIDIGAAAPSAPEESAAAEASAKIEGKVAPGLNDDEDRLVFEALCFLEIEEDDESGGDLAPYLVSIEADAQQVIALYRYWAPEDKDREPLKFLIQLPFIRWRGAYPLGIMHLIGGLEVAATGALNALLDSAHLNNAQAAVKLKGGASGGKSVTIRPGEIAEIDGAMQTDDIRKTVMPLPFNPPSTALFQLLGFLSEAAKGVVRTTFDNLSDQSANMPVGTTLALIEQGMKVFSAIHTRLHQAMQEVYTALHQINRMHLTEDTIVSETGELLVRREDFEGPMDVVPVSDPNISSETQRMAQMQMVVARATGNPLYDPRKVEELFLERTKIPNAKDLLVPRPEPKRLNPVNENVAASMGQPIVAFPDQNHIAHLQVHVNYVQAMAMNPLIGPAALPLIVNHIKDHLVYLYVAAVVRAVETAAGTSAASLMDDDADVAFAYDEMLAMASAQVLPQMGQALQELGPVVQQAMMMMQQFAPQGMGDPLEPMRIQAQAKRAEVQVKAQDAQAKQAGAAEDRALKREELTLEAAQEERLQQERLEAQRRDFALAYEELDRADDRHTADLETKVGINVADNLTALSIAQGEFETGENVAVSTGRGINPSP
jgi:hypothetical protein